MKSLPSNVKPYKRTPTFTASTIPEGLKHRHDTKAGTWARIVVLEGRLRYRILEPMIEEVELSPDHAGVVEPEVPHEVEALGAVRFYLEFLRAEVLQP